MPLARPCPLPYTPSPPTPASFSLLNPLIELGQALPCLSCHAEAGPADKWVIGEGQLRCPWPERVTPGWLAAHPQHLLPALSQNQASRRQQILSCSSVSGRPQAATGNLSYAKPLRIAASLPCPGTAGPDRAPLPAGTASGKLALPGPMEKTSLQVI